MARIKHNSKEIGLLARLMRSEAVGDREGLLCTFFRLMMLFVLLKQTFTLCHNAK